MVDPAPARPPLRLPAPQPADLLGDLSLADVVAHLPGYVALIGEDGSVHLASPAAEEVLRESSEDADPSWVEEDGSPLTRDRYPVWEAMYGPPVVLGRLIGRREPLGIRWFRVDARRVAERHPRAVAVAATDISERVVIEQRLHESNARLGSLFKELEAALAGDDAYSWAWDLKQRCLLWVDEVGARRVGVDPSRLAEEPMSFFDQVHPDDRAHVREVFLSAPQAGFVDVVYRFRGIDGRERLQRALAVTHRDALGVPERVDGTFIALRSERDREETGVERTVARVRSRLGDLAELLPEEVLRRVPLEGLSGYAELSERELEVLELVAAGLRTSTIAKRTYVSASTVRNHLSAIYRKLGVSSQLELVALLVEAKAAHRSQPED